MGKIWKCILDGFALQVSNSYVVPSNYSSSTIWCLVCLIPKMCFSEPLCVSSMLLVFYLFFVWAGRFLLRETIGGCVRLASGRIRRQATGQIHVGLFHGRLKQQLVRPGHKIRRTVSRSFEH